VAEQERVITLAQVAELEAWVKQVRLDYELQQMGFDPAAPPPPQWLRESGETVP
jgi:hypothetical protein